MILLVSSLCLPALSLGAEPAARRSPSFERDVLPLFSTSCLKCHGEGKLKGGLDLRTPTGIGKGSESGPVLVKGDADASLLFEVVSTGKMPPGKNKLTESQVRLIREWISAGAPAEHPERPAPNSIAADRGREHWAFQRVASPKVPRAMHTDRVRTPVDAFLLERLEGKGLTFSPDADRVTLLRRAYLDLWGLPPTPEDVEAFLADTRPDAYEHWLDRLLASPHFGERWARHWLDVVGYADTVGFDIDANIIIMSAGKWRYRDWVIDAFNRDMPYDRFVTEQLAGDELLDWRNAPRFTPEMRASLIATGFLRTARDQTHEPESNIPLCYYGVLHDTVSIVGNSLLGLTLTCAQCHNHKFDPVTQKEYYRLMAVFTPAYNPRAWKPVYPWKPEIKDRGLDDVSPREKAEIEEQNRDLDRRIAELSGRRDSLRRPHEERLRKAKLKTLPEPLQGDTEKALRIPAEKRNAVQKYLAEKLGPLVVVKAAEIDAALNADDRAAVGRIDTEIAAIRAQHRTTGKIQAIYDVGPPPATYFLKRGNHETPGEEVEPGYLAVLCDSEGSASGRPAQAAGASSGRRLGLASWLTEPDTRASGLLARVMVNRVWQHLFGEGLVSTPENFGLGGERPTHPELLEWLSAELANGGWRLKPMIKRLMTSTAYRQASHRTESSSEPENVDPGNRLLWRMRLRRLEAESIRDAILTVSGRLNPAMGGPPVLLTTLPEGLVVIDEKALPNPSARDKRSIYLLFRRAYNLSLLTVFDQPAVSLNCPARDASAVPLQPLTMLNDVFLSEQSKHFADRVAKAAGTDGEPAVRRAFRTALARDPNPAELATCVRLLERQAALFRQEKHAEPEARRRALTELCHTLLNTSEFLYVE